jgi:hypothetical protein
VSEELVRLFYRFVHPSLPVLGSRQGFEKQRQKGNLPGFLLATVYLHGAHYWHTSPLSEYHDTPAHQHLVPQLCSYLTGESKTATLTTVQAALLFMHFPSRVLGPSAGQDFWKFSAMTVAMAQSINLHMEPDCWEHTPGEQKVRRVVSWAVFINDKWMAHWLSRPSHMHKLNFSVAPLTFADFSDDEDRIDVKAVSYGTSFLALSLLTDLLCDVIDTFYSVQSRFDRMPVSDVLSRARGFVDRLRQWKQDYPFPTLTDQAHQFTVQIGAFSVCLAIHCALHGAYKLAGSEDTNILAGNTVVSIRRDLVSVMQGIQKTRPLGLWLAHNKGVFVSIATSLFAIVQASEGDGPYAALRLAVLDFIDHLRGLAGEFVGGVGMFDFARWAIDQPMVVSILEALGDDSSVPVRAGSADGGSSAAESCGSSGNGIGNHGCGNPTFDVTFDRESRGSVTTTYSTTSPSMGGESITAYSTTTSPSSAEDTDAMSVTVFSVAEMTA